MRVSIISGLSDVDMSGHLWRLMREWPTPLSMFIVFRVF